MYFCTVTKMQNLVNVEKLKILCSDVCISVTTIFCWIDWIIWWDNLSVYFSLYILLKGYRWCRNMVLSY